MTRRYALPRGGLGLAFVLSVALVLASCGGGEPQASPAAREVKNVTFMAGFKPQANLPFVAAYVAQEKGYFAEQGLKVDIRHAASGEHLRLLLSGDVEVTTADAESVLRRRSDPGAPLRAIALFGQRGQQAYMVLEKSGIRSPKEWEGKTFGYKVSQPPSYLALLKASGADRSRVQEVPVGFDPRILTEGRVDILAVFKSNEPDTVRRLGFPVRVFDPADFGVPTMGLTYIVNDGLIARDPDLIQRFLKATLRGFQFALENEDATLDIVMKYAPQEDREHQRFMLTEELRDAVSDLTRANGLGWMAEGQWKALYNQLQEFQALPRPFDHRTAYDDQFLKRVYKGGKLAWP